MICLSYSVVDQYSPCFSLSLSASLKANLMRFVGTRLFPAERHAVKITIALTGSIVNYILVLASCRTPYRIMAFKTQIGVLDNGAVAVHALHFFCVPRAEKK